MKTCKSCKTVVNTYDRYCSKCQISWPAERRWEEKTFREKYFSFEGRLNRKRFIICYVIGIIPILLLNFIIELLVEQTNYYALFLVFLIAVPLIWFSLSIHIRRWHDMNQSGYYTLLNTLGGSVTVLGVMLIAYMSIKKGTIGDNRYGSDLLEEVSKEESL